MSVLEPAVSQSEGDLTDRSPERPCDFAAACMCLEAFVGVRGLYEYVSVWCNQVGSMGLSVCFCSQCLLSALLMLY